MPSAPSHSILLLVKFVQFAPRPGSPSLFVAGETRRNHTIQIELLKCAPSVVGTRARDAFQGCSCVKDVACAGKGKSDDWTKGCGSGAAMEVRCCHCNGRPHLRMKMMSSGALPLTVAMMCVIRYRDPCFFPLFPRAIISTILPGPLSGHTMSRLF